MSRLMDICAAVQTRIEASATLAGVPVHIDRQKDIAAEVATAVAKLSLCVVLYPTRADRASGGTSADPFRATVVAEIYASPILRAGRQPDLAADDAAEAVAAALDGWIPDGSATTHNVERVTVAAIELVPDREYLVWRVTAGASFFIEPDQN